MKELDLQNMEPEDEELDTRADGVAPASIMERAFQLLNLLMVSEQGMALSELARTLNVSKGSMHRLLKMLEGCGVVSLQEERFYVLGPRIYKLAIGARGVGLRRLALPAMQRLVAQIGETIFLARLENESIHVIESVEAGGEHLFPHVSVPRGTRIPLPAGAVARLVFAYWPLERRRYWLQNHSLPRFTEHSLTDSEQFLAAIQETAEIGMGIDRGEYIGGVNAIAVPITGADGSFIASLCALGFTSHFTTDALQDAGRVLRIEAENIAHALEPK